MSKGRNPRRRSEDAAREIGPKTEAPALVPPAAVTAQTSPQPVLFHIVQAVRFAAGAVVDLADAVADAITKRVAGRA